MSLQLAAQHLSSKGRGNDSRLIHVSPRELQGLQALAKAKGGSLTINPETGLPEAGFLEDVLPIAATAALMFVPGGPALAGSVGGALTGGLASGALATGIGTGLLAGGASILGQALGGGRVDMGKAATTGVLSGLAGGMFAPGTPSADVATPVKALEAAQATTPAGAGSGVDKAFAFNSAGEMVPANYAADITGATNLPAAAPEASKSFFGSLSPKQKLGLGLGATGALSLLGGMNQPKMPSAPTSPSYIRPYTYSQTRNPNYGQPGEAYYNQSYTALPPYRAAAGGIMEASYPQSGIDRTQYATPTQMPTSAEVVADYDVATNPYTGMPTRMAEGGDTKEAVKQYNEMLSKQAAEEYLKSPTLPAFLSAPPPAAKAEAAPSVGEGVKGLYQYYLGRQPSAEEMPQWTDRIKSTGMVTPEEAAYFRQFVGAEQAARGFAPTGPDPFGQVAPSGLIGQLVDQMPTAISMNPYQYVPGKGYIPNPNYRPMTTMPVGQPAVADTGGGAGGGLMPYNLGGYSDGGRLLKGPGDGVSDDIPATIGRKQPARLADGEFVIPARIVSEIGNGSTDAGARKLYAMMDRVQEKRKKSSKKGKFAIDSKADKVMPA
jgi:hypothetical protein